MEKLGHGGHLGPLIQVRSVLTDTWVTINHGLEYKALSGQPSKGERKILDSIKGLVDTGEVLLEHLRQIHRLRLESDSQDMKNTQDLKEVLLDVLDISLLGPTGEIGDARPLFDLLEMCGVTKRGDLRMLLKKVGIAGKPISSIDSFGPSFSRLSICYFVLDKLLRELPNNVIIRFWEIPITHGPRTSSLLCWMRLKPMLYIALAWLRKARERASGQGPWSRKEYSRCIMLFFLILTFERQMDGTKMPVIDYPMGSIILAILRPVSKSSEPLVDFALFLSFIKVLSSKNHGFEQVELGNWMADIACDRLLWRNAVQGFSHFCEQNWTGDEDVCNLKILDAEVGYWAALHGSDDLLEFQINESQDSEARIKRLLWLLQYEEQREGPDLEKRLVKSKLTSMLNSATSKIKGLGSCRGSIAKLWPRMRRESRIALGLVTRGGRV
jgi:hypothetical protein